MNSLVILLPLVVGVFGLVAVFVAEDSDPHAPAPPLQQPAGAHAAYAWPAPDPDVVYDQLADAGLVVPTDRGHLASVTALETRRTARAERDHVRVVRRAVP